jgi:hypothetical protein
MRMPRLSIARGTVNENMYVGICLGAPKREAEGNQRGAATYFIAAVNIDAPRRQL